MRRPGQEKGMTQGIPAMRFVLPTGSVPIAARALPCSARRGSGDRRLAEEVGDEAGRVGRADVAEEVGLEDPHRVPRRPARGRDDVGRDRVVRAQEREQAREERRGDASTRVIDQLYGRRGDQDREVTAGPWREDRSSPVGPAVLPVMVDPTDRNVGPAGQDRGPGGPRLACHPDPTASPWPRLAGADPRSRRRGRRAVRCRWGRSRGSGGS
jgi:hypothetical protein